MAQEDLRVYSDGSAIDGGVGGTAVLMRGEEVVREKRFHLGSDKEHAVYEGELIGMILAVELLREEGGKGTLALGVDNQAAITATGAFNSKPGHYLMDIFHDDLRKIIPAHDQRKLVIRAGRQVIRASQATKQPTSKPNSQHEGTARKTLTRSCMMPRVCTARWKNQPLAVITCPTGAQHPSPLSAHSADIPEVLGT